MKKYKDLEQKIWDQIKSQAQADPCLRAISGIRDKIKSEEKVSIEYQLGSEMRLNAHIRISSTDSLVYTFSDNKIEWRGY